MGMNTAIVTGATGFVGSWLVEELLANGYQVSVIVRNASRLLPHIAKHPQCRIIEGEISKLLPSDIMTREADVFFHLAWGGVDSKDKNNLHIQLENIQLALDALELSNKIGCRKFIASGTVAEYVFCEDVMNVNSRQTPNDYYGAAKVSVHHFLEVRARQLSQDFIWAMLPSTFGERRHDNNIITYTITTLLRGDRPLYGDLLQMWDFLYVSEVARALRLLGERGLAGKVYGIGSGQYKLLRDYIIQIKDMIDPNLELGIGEVPAMSQQTFSSCVNTYALFKDTGFYPKVSFEEGIKRTIEYWEKRI